METHVKIIGWLFLVLNVLFLAVGLLFMFAMMGAGVASGEAQGAAAGLGLGAFFGVCFLILSLPGILGGWGLLQHKNWARILVIILAILNLPNIPIGTALGVYALVILFNKEAQQLFT